MNPELLALLVCPACKGPLLYRESGDELVCCTDRIAFPVRNGVPVLLMPDARPLTGEEIDSCTGNGTGDET